MKKTIFKSVLVCLLLASPIFSYAAISDQVSDNSKLGSQVLETYAKMLDFCHKNDTDIDSCLRKLKAKSTETRLDQKQLNSGFCCRNVSGGWGEYAYIHGQDYCIPPC